MSRSTPHTSSTPLLSTFFGLLAVYRTSLSSGRNGRSSLNRSIVAYRLYRREPSRTEPILHLSRSPATRSTCRPLVNRHLLIRTLYVGSLNADGTTTVILIVTLLETTPDVAAAVDEANGGHAIVTTRDEGPTIRFCAAVLPQFVAEAYLVTPEPLTETDAAIAVVLGTAFFWV